MSKRPAKDRIMTKLDDIRNLVERHCGDTKQAVREAVAESLVALSPALSQQQPMMEAPLVTESGTCPGGAQGWNEFQKKFKEENKEYLKTIPYYEVRQKISNAWKTYKATVCVKKTKTRKVKQPLLAPNQFLLAPNQPSISTFQQQPLVAPNVQRQPTFMNTVQEPNNEQEIVEHQPKGKTLKIKDFKKKIGTLRENTELRNRELYMIGEENPEFTQYTNPLRNRIAEQQEELNSIYKNYRSQRGQPNNNRTKRNQFKSRIASLEYRRNQVNQNMRTLQARVYEKTQKKRNNNDLAKRHVRILAANSVIAKTPGSPKNNSPKNNSPKNNSPKNNSPKNNISKLRIRVPQSPNNEESSGRVVNNPLNTGASLLGPVNKYYTGYPNVSENSPNAIKENMYMGAYQSNNNKTPTPKSKLEVIGPSANLENWYNAKINGKRYLYQNNNQGKRLIEVLNNDGIGDYGYYNESAPGYFRANE